MILITTIVNTSTALLLLLLLLQAFPRFLPDQQVGGYAEVQKAWQARTFVDFGQASSFGQASFGQDSRAGCDGLRRRGVWRNSGGRFSA